MKVLYRIAFSREARDKEVQQAMEFLKNRSSQRSKRGREEATELALTPLGELAHVVLNSNEFVYIN